jgi:hypothetical protein
MNFRTILLTLLFSANVFADHPHVMAQLPAQELRAGDLVEIPINIVSGSMEIVSYAVELKFDPSLVRLVGVYPGLTPWYHDQPLNRQIGSRTISITGSANSFGNSQKIINVANFKFELISEQSKPRFELLQAGPTVRKQGFSAITASYTVEGEMDLYNIIFDGSFERE